MNTTATPPKHPYRIESIDALRGLAMIVMALDHTRDYFGALNVSPTNMGTTTVALFLTRWITHVCAPTFFLLTGIGARLSRASASPRTLAKFLIVRGLILVLLELTVLRSFAYQFNVDYHVTGLVVIWALGCAMIFLGCIVFLPVWLIAALGVAMIAGHNLLDGVRSTHPAWLIVHQPGLIPLDATHAIFVAYPLVPWIGVTALGYALGAVYRWPPERRRALLVRAGGASITAFLAMRAINVYGDPVPWTTQKSAVFTALSFINTNKYPPSLLFLLMTLGAALLALRTMDAGVPRLLRPVLNYGRAPLFYFVAHFVLIHALAVVVALFRYGSAHWFFESPTVAQYPYTSPPDWAYPLPVVYAVWLVVVIALYPACRAFAQMKARSPHGWLSYF